MKNLLIILPLVFLISSCSSIKFNNNFENSNWSTILVSPHSSAPSEFVLEQFMHEFGTDESINFIGPARIENVLKAQNLSKEYAENPIETLSLVARELKAEGFIIFDVNMGRSLESPPFASVKTTLYSTESLQIVSSTLHKRSSLLFTNQYNLQQASDETMSELSDIFKKIHSGYQK